MRDTVPWNWIPWGFRMAYEVPDPLPWPADLLDGLNEQQRRVLTARLDLDGKGRRTLDATGAELGVKRERVRQIESKALRILIPQFGWRWKGLRGDE